MPTLPASVRNVAFAASVARFQAGEPGQIAHRLWREAYPVDTRGGRRWRGSSPAKEILPRLTLTRKRLHSGSGKGKRR
jgi:hypothetical protein